MLLPAALGALALMAMPSRAFCQGRYLKSDVGHPVRIGDALPEEQGELHLHLPGARFERFDSEIGRWRFEPGLSYGILPLTSIEVRTSFVYREPGAVPRWGMSGAGFSLFQGVFTQAKRRPAVALEGDWYEPVGGARSGGRAITLRSLTSYDFGVVRVHFNAQFGSYAVDLQPQLKACTLADIAFGIPCSGKAPRAPPDVPCGPAPNDAVIHAAQTCVSGSGTAILDPTSQVVPAIVRLRNRHWVAGVAVDHDFTGPSLLVIADVYAERFLGLLDKPDWTAEAGLRKQVTRESGVEASLGRHFYGTVHSWILNVGASLETRAHF